MGGRGKVDFLREGSGDRESGIGAALSGGGARAPPAGFSRDAEGPENGKAGPYNNMYRFRVVKILKQIFRFLSGVIFFLFFGRFNLPPFTNKKLSPVFPGFSKIYFQVFFLCPVFQVWHRSRTGSRT